MTIAPSIKNAYIFLVMWNIINERGEDKMAYYLKVVPSFMFFKVHYVT